MLPLHTSENSLRSLPLFQQHQPLPTKAVISRCPGHFPSFSAPGSSGPSTPTQAIPHNFDIHTGESPAPWPLQSSSPLSSLLPSAPHFLGIPWTWCPPEAVPSLSAYLLALLSLPPLPPASCHCLTTAKFFNLVQTLRSRTPLHCYLLLASPLFWHCMSHGPSF